MTFDSDASTATRTALRRCGPLLVLLGGLALLFPAFWEAGPLHREALFHDHITFDHLSVAKNLSAEHGWLGFYHRALNEDGEPVYGRVYNRFPPAGYFLIKLAVLTQPGDLAGQVQAARMLMLALYAGAAALAYFSLALVVGRRWFALAATLAAFGSYAALCACDMVATEGVVDLFGTMLALHGVARYCFPGEPGVPAAPGERRRFGQMLAKACAALLLGWHVFALLAPFVALGLAAALVARDRPELRRLLLFGALAFLFGLAVLVQNFGREYLALDGETPVWELPSFKSMKAKSVFHEQREGNWLPFALDQLQRAGLALAPYAVTRVDVWWRGWAVLGAFGFAVVGAGALLALAPAASAARQRVQTASRVLVPLALTGLAWAVGMRGNIYSYQWTWGRESRSEAWDVFESMFHVGVPLAAFALLALLLPIRPNRTRLRQLAAIAVVAVLCLAFAASVLHMGQLDRHPEMARQERAMLADLDAARRMAAGRSIFPYGQVWPAPWPRHNYVSVGRAPHFYFANHAHVRKPERAAAAELVLAPRIRHARTSTPDNRFYFLYGMAEYLRHCGAPRLCKPAGEPQRG